jgi:hypothetical protein
MRFVAIDLETTGLEPGRDDILQIGVVLFDFITPEEELPRWECVIAHERIAGHPVALAMNAKLIEQIANCERHPGVQFYDTCEVAYTKLGMFLSDNGLRRRSDQKIHLVVAGKNAAGFDLPFLNAPQNGGPTWRANFAVKHRVFDVGSLYFQHGDAGPPNLKTCLERAGRTKEVEHTAVADALDVVRLLRFKYGVDPNPERD